MLALGGVCAGSRGGAGPGFKTIAHTSCKDGFWENEAEVVPHGDEEAIQRIQSLTSLVGLVLCPVDVPADFSRNREEHCYV